MTRRAIEQNFLGNEALGFVGARSTYFKLQLTPNETTQFKFSEHDIPIGARILYINYTPQNGNLFPIEMHGNVATRRFTGDQVAVFPVHLVKTSSPVPTEVSVLATWIPEGESDDAWQCLYDAFDAFVAEKFNAVVVPANVAVETTLFSLMASYLEPTISRKRVDDFLTNAATYSHQLNILLPIFSELKQLPRLPIEIVGLLNRLRGLRNDLAHGGTTTKPLERKEVADLLAASLFGFHYIRYLHEQSKAPG